MGKTLKGPIFIEGLKIGGYRSFDNTIALQNFSKINILIGQNNSGKSNVLRFLSRHLLGVQGKPSIPFNQTSDAPQRENRQKFSCELQLSKNGPIINLIKRNLGENGFFLPSLFSKQEKIWYPFQHPQNKFELNKQKLYQEADALGLNRDQWYSLFNRVNRSQGGQLQQWQESVLSTINPAVSLPSEVSLIPASRTLRTIQTPKLSRDSTGYYLLNGIKEHGGIGLVEELGLIQNPKLENASDRKRFDQINEFIREVTGNESVSLEVPHDRSSVYVRMDGKLLDIEDLGSGIEQVLIIAAKSTLFSKQIVCIEEPELFLHPSLQRKLLIYLYEKTNNQYFIATHSAHLMDTVPASIYHIKLEDGYSSIISAITDNQKFLACQDLGFKASDLLQANCIIWVEGPSDRIYLNSWISNKAPHLKENLDYSIMFYGGRLLSRLSVNEEAVDDFIQLQKLNQNVAIIIDSDFSIENKELNNTKNRILSEFQKRNGLTWITAGKEIENYISKELWEKTLLAVYQPVLLPVYGEFNDLTKFWMSESRTKKDAKDIDKMKIAHSIANEDVNFSILDLNDRLNELVQFIEQSNLKHA